MWKRPLWAACWAATLLLDACGATPMAGHVAIDGGRASGVGGSAIVTGGTGGSPAPSDSLLSPSSGLSATSCSASAVNSVDSFVLAAGPTSIDTDAALYARIDGAAPKLIDRGWVGSAWTTYAQGGVSIDVEIDDMGTPENARALYIYDLPVSRLSLDGTPDAVLDLGLLDAYHGSAVVGHYVIHVASRDRSDTALEQVKQFVTVLANRCR